jgi:hypothetical protein
MFLGQSSTLQSLSHSHMIISLRVMNFFSIKLTVWKLILSPVHSVLIVNGILKNVYTIRTNINIQRILFWNFTIPCTVYVHHELWTWHSLKTQISGNVKWPITTFSPYRIYLSTMSLSELRSICSVCSNAVILLTRCKLTEMYKQN